MEIVIVPIFLMVALGVLILITNVVQGRGQWTKAFEQLATRYGGWFSPARLTRPPAAAFKYKEIDVRVRCRRTRREGGLPETEFRIGWPDKNSKIEMASIGARAPKIRSLRQATPKMTGDKVFDNDFRVFTGPYGTPVERLLSSGVRWQIQQLARFLNQVPLRLTIHRGHLTVHKKVYIKSTQELDDFVRFCLELYDQFSLTMNEGIEFHDDMVMSAVDDVHCPICSSMIEGKMVVCVRCKTPHCLDCWQYNIKCGMYACNETRYLLVGSENTP